MYDQETKQDFLDTYDEVFDANGEVTACGRNTCKKLIKLAGKLDPSGKPYGNHTDGFIDIDKMKELHKKISK